MRLRAIALLLLLPSTVLAQRPDPELTPGSTRPLSRAVLCGTRWGTDNRAVSTAMKRHVYRAYGVPWASRGAYEVDHLVPRSLGGRDDILNLWPQPWIGEAGARRKDRLEIKLSALYCAGGIGLEAARRVFREDWSAGYRRYVEGKQ